MRNLSDLSRRDLEELVAYVVICLWTDDVGDKPNECILGFAPDLEWDQETVEMIASKFDGLDLKPDVPESPAEATRLMEEWEKSGAP